MEHKCVDCGSTSYQGHPGLCRRCAAARLDDALAREGDELEKQRKKRQLSESRGSGHPGIDDPAEGGPITVLISQEKLTQWLNKNRLVLSVGFKERAYRAELSVRLDDERLVPACTARAADYDVAVVAACNLYERSRGGQT